MNDWGKMLVTIGIAIAVIGLMVGFGVGKNWLGHLPGDIHYTRGNFSFHFPMVTCLLASVILTVILWLLRK